MHIKKGDKVKVLTGRDAGKTGEVVKAMPKDNRVVVAGVNVMKRHLRPRRQGEPGQIIDKESPIHASNVVKAK
ncbi:MAG: 50S ribosomal protein L24 [Patescibacteria group bacterium]|nr:50S ribosomal protein L24 [Patescibacteria group bacterium]